MGFWWCVLWGFHVCLRGVFVSVFVVVGLVCGGNWLGVGALLMWRVVRWLVLGVRVGRAVGIRCFRWFGGCSRG